MNTQHCTPQILQKYGIPKVVDVLGTTYLDYNSGQVLGWSIAKSLAVSALLENIDAQKLAASAQSQADWERVAQAEGIPLVGYTPPSITKSLQELPLRAKLSEVTFDQDFLTTLTTCLSLYSSSCPSLKAATYPLLEGPPGASKSMVVNVLAALLRRPVYTVTGTDGSADEIKIDLMGGHNANSMDLAGLAYHYIDIGWLHNPVSVKLVAKELTTKSIDAFSDDFLLSIAHLEHIKDGITAEQPGKYQLAALHGGILFLDEVNGFKGVATILTEILENYTKELHPNFFIVGALNPAGAKHDREPLAKELRSRFITIPVTAPTEASYAAMLSHQIYGIQPEVKFFGKKVRMDVGTLFEYTLPPKKPSKLLDILEEASLDKLIANYAGFHKNIEVLLEDGKLDPRTVAEEPTLETRACDRRSVVRFMNIFDTLLHSEPTTSMVRKVSTYNFDSDATKITTKRIISALTGALDACYTKPFSFGINEEINVTADGDTKKKNIKNTSVLIEETLRVYKLNQDSLSYLRTKEDNVQVHTSIETLLRELKLDLGLKKPIYGYLTRSDMTELFTTSVPIILPHEGKVYLSLIEPNLKQLTKASNSIIKLEDSTNFKNYDKNTKAYYATMSKNGIQPTVDQVKANVEAFKQQLKKVLAVCPKTTLVIPLSHPTEVSMILASTADDGSVQLKLKSGVVEDTTFIKKLNVTTLVDTPHILLPLVFSC